MELFQTVQKLFKKIGIHWPHQYQRYSSSFNWINFVYFVGYAQSITSSSAFILFEAKTAVEYGFAFYVFITGWAAASAVSISILKKEKLFNIVQNCDKFIEMSK